MDSTGDGAVEVSLRYGRGELHLEVPEANLAGVLRPRVPAPDAAPPRLGFAALGAVEVAVTGERVLLLAPDGTRSLPPESLLSPLLRALAGARSVDVLLATGSHRADTSANRDALAALAAAARRAGAPVGEGAIHDCRTARFTDHGLTAHGTPVRLASALDTAEAFVVLADVKPHYFAGYSNPLKYFLPGVAAFETIERNHRLALEPDAAAGRHPFHPDPRRRTNPVAEDMLEAFDRIRRDRPVFALTTVMTGGRLVHAGLGGIETVSAEAFAASDRIASFSVAPVSRVVISAGGAPQDATLYLAQRAIELTRDAAAAGAEILLLAECGDGIADGEVALENFYRELARPLPEVVRRIRTGYRLYQHKAYRFAELLNRVAAIHVTSALPEETLRAVHLAPAPDPQALVDRWCAEDPAARILFLDEANRLSVHAA